MAQFAAYLADGCEVMARAYVKRRAADANAARPKCSNPALRRGAGSCVIYGRGFWCRLQLMEICSWHLSQIRRKYATTAAGARHFPGADRGDCVQRAYVLQKRSES